MSLFHAFLQAAHERYPHVVEVGEPDDGVIGLICRQLRLKKNRDYQVLMPRFFGRVYKFRSKEKAALFKLFVSR